MAGSETTTQAAANPGVASSGHTQPLLGICNASLYAKPSVLQVLSIPAWPSARQSADPTRLR